MREVVLLSAVCVLANNARGTAVGECAISSIATVCVAMGQACYDPDAAVTGDWECRCVAPQNGPTTVGAATVCIFDECTAVCATCANHSSGNVCTKVGQTCQDPNTDTRSTGDWTCTCPPPTSGSSVASAATCIENECIVDANVKTCAAAGQVCIDPKPQPTNKGDWECHCAQGNVFAVAAAAVCVLDECAGQCPTCADKGFGNLCSVNGQLCVDTNKDTVRGLNTWECRCIAPKVGSKVSGAAVCLVNECDVHRSTCSAVDQDCLDLSTSTDGDWQCGCRAPSYGRATAQAATCLQDECTVWGKTCTDSGQWCHDPDLSAQSLGDWNCLCVAPSVGLGLQTAAVCLFDECKTNSVCQEGGQLCVDSDLGEEGTWSCACVAHAGVGVPAPQLGGLADCYPPASECSIDAIREVCTSANQGCYDPDLTVQNDWVCECLPPATGSQKQGEATVCVLDECAQVCPTCGRSVCAAVGQTCTDANTDAASVSDWTCTCPPPTSGSSVASAATCIENECIVDANVKTCTAAGQVCIDPKPQPTNKGDWECHCAQGKTFAVAAAAVCVLDECTAQCPTCADKGFGNLCDVAGQHCVESSTSPANLEDWMCKCVGDAVGESVTSVAVCTLDECLMNNGRLAKLCGAAGQTCNDPNKAVIGGLDDWECVCPPPTIGRGTGKLATCVRDECLESDVAVVCTSAGQTCQDPNTDTRSTGDWTCSCAKGDVPNVATGQAATCVAPVSWCVQHGDMCTSQGQACIPAANIQDAGSCACIAPQTGLTKVGAATVCILDECTAMCATCADHGAGNVCTKAGQTCTEGSTNPVTGTRDWRCKCAVSDASAVAAVAVCTVNECDTDPKAKVCTAAEQTCTDKNTAEDSLGDWMCTCHAPSTGSKMLGAADCSFDECLLYGSECTGLGQTCQDKDTSTQVLGDWECRCVLPAEGFAVAKAATCVYNGECGVQANKDVCTSAGQTCVDPNPAAVGDWECRCVSPEAGAGTLMAVAVCFLDECRATCTSCATKPGSQTHACASAEQDCVDPDTAATSIADWMCVCRAPASGEMAGAAAVCSVDECYNAENRAACSRVKDTTGAEVQHCVDKDYTKTGDWVCECVYPYHGTTGLREAAVCVVDECTAPEAWSKKPNGNAVCGAQGQTCLDPQQGVASELGNWVCQCADGTGEPNRGAPSTDCKQDTLCAQFGSACGPLESCVEKADVWSCRCIPPFMGEAAGKAASCALDECTADCSTCAQKGSVHTCTQAGQKCVDHNKSPDSRSDWSCVCEVGKGEAALHAAVCMLDECLLNGVTCEGMGQECVDPDMRVEKSGDWVCQCIAPASGKAVAGPASCLLDECSVYGGNCTVAGQLCIDHNTAPASLGDWTCNCPAPAVGVGYAGPASCTYDLACTVATNVNVCADAGQRCISGDSSDDFTCACMPPYHGTAGERAPAQCVIDECEDICATCARTSASAMNVCVGAGQRCEDPNLSVQSLGDWVCMCQAPSTTATVARAVNSCLVDECLDVTMTGARKCDNFKRYTNDGCECACGWMVTGIDGSGAGLSEPCNTGCCNPDRAKEGDWCLVADSAFNKQSAVCSALISKQKTCANARAPAPAGAPVSEFVDVCAAAGQRCSDPNHSPFAQGDWECHCTTSSDYHVLGPAKCSMLFCFCFCFF